MAIMKFTNKEILNWKFCSGGGKRKNKKENKVCYKNPICRSKGSSTNT